MFNLPSTLAPPYIALHLPRSPWLRLSTTRAAHCERVGSRFPAPLTAYSRSARLRSYTGANLLLLCFCDLRGAWAAGVRERWFD